MDEINFWSAARTRDAIVSGDVGIGEVTDAHLARHEATHDALNAIVSVSDDIAAQTGRLEALAPEECGPLHGVPVTIKVNVDVESGPNTNGVAAFADMRCAEDSPLVANLRKAGAVILARTNTPEFSLRFFTSNPLHGITRNPWDATLTPGGSSGGAASSLAAGVGTIAHGNDLGGSLRYPAYCCGLSTIRPSMGRVPAFNPSAPAERPPITLQMSVQGPIARSIADVRIGLAAMAGHDARDPMWSAAAASGRTRSGAPRIAVSVDTFGGSTDGSVRDAMARATAAISEAGMEAVEVALPDPERLVELWGQLLCTEVEHMMAPAIREHGSEGIVAVCEAYTARFGTLDLPGYLAACGERTALQRRWAQMFDTVDAVLMPVSLSRPFPNDHDLTGQTTVFEVLEAQRPLYAINLLGLPSVALPTHVDQGGAPSGVQLVGAMHDDWHILDIAERLQDVLGTVGPPSI